jgi:hypothetical protein
MKKIALATFVFLAVLPGGLAACKSDPEKDLTCAGSDCVEVSCNNPPDIVRVEFDPKEGKVPFNVTFNVKAEDPDDICPDPSYKEKLTYFWDFNGDGYVDRKTNTGDKITVPFDTAGDYKMSFWVADARNNTSSKISKFIRATENKPPIISNFRAAPNVAALQGGKAQINFYWSAKDPDGRIAKIELDYGDGLATLEAGSFIAVNFTSAGNKTAKLTVFDAEGASVSAQTDVVISIAMQTSEFIQTVGASTAFAINDNGGNYYPTPHGPASYVYVADGEIALKALRYPMSAFATGSTLHSAELIGMADHGSDSDLWKDVVTHDNIAVVSGNHGMLVYNVAANTSNICKNPWDTNCYPGTPTQPVAICGSSQYMDQMVPSFSSHQVNSLQLLYPTASGEVWAVAAVVPQISSFGGLYGVRIDQYANASGYVNPHVQIGYTGYQVASGELTGMGASEIDMVAVGDSIFDPVAQTGAVVIAKGKTPEPYVRVAAGTTGFANGVSRILRVFRGITSGQHCWHHLNNPPTINDTRRFHNDPDFLPDPTAMVIRGDYAYVGTQGDGFRVFNLGAAFSTVPKTPLDKMPTLWKLTNLVSYWPFSGASAAALDIAESRPVTGRLEPVGVALRQAFVPYSSFVSSSGGYPDCAETPSTVSVAGSFVSGGTATLATSRPFFPGNRVAIGLSDGAEDTNNGQGYRVISDYADPKMVIEGVPYTDPATWSSVRLQGVTHAAMLPSYPGTNAVTFSSGATESIARSGKCLNVVLSYASVTEPVSVSFDTAPILLASIMDLTKKGLFAFDISVPHSPVLLDTDSPALVKFNVPGKIETNGNWAFLGYGAKGPIEMFDISDPYHLKESYASSRETLGTFAYQKDVTFEFAIADFAYVTTPNNPEGVLMVANGAMGMAAVYVDAALRQGKGKVTQFCDSKFNDSSCMQWVPGLQLRHDGAINNISLTDNNYALVSQKRGGVLVYDVSGTRYGANPKFVSHVRTEDDPVSMRLVTDSTGTRQLFIADTTRYYLTPFSDPAHPGAGSWTKIPGYAGKYNCVDNVDGKNFICADAGKTSAVLYFSLGWDDNAGRPWRQLNLGVDPSLTPTNQCTYNGSPYNYTGTFSRLQTDFLAGRLFFFAHTNSDTLIGEIVTDGNGNFVLNGNDGQACLWRRSYGGKSAYQNRAGAWKRLYIGGSDGLIRVFDIDGYEAKVADPATPDLRVGPSQLGEINLSAIHASNLNPVFLERMVPVGPYLFVSAHQSGGWVLDVSDGYNPRVIGRTSISVGDMTVTAMNALAFPRDPGNPAAGYDYVALIADNKDKGGIQMIRFDGLLPP